MNIISQTIEYKGNPIKIQNNKIYVLAFGTTITNHNMHHSWKEIPQDKIHTNFKQWLTDNKLIN